MPIFEYRCPDCERIDEHLELSATPPYTRQCPDCRIPMERLTSKAAFIIRGYNARTGYATKESR